MNQIQFRHWFGGKSKMMVFERRGRLKIFMICNVNVILLIQRVAEFISDKDSYLVEFFFSVIKCTHVLHVILINERRETTNCSS